jgi:tetratricopeptide (TPR) repeat protein
MTNPVRSVALVVVLAIGHLALPLMAPKDTWLRVRTQHLLIVSSAGEGATSEVARRLERFVDAVSSIAGIGASPEVPVTVMVFRNSASFARFRPLQNGRTMNWSGYFQRADDENTIALSLESSADGDPYRVIFHEYAHALTSRSADRWPLWLQEGLAEFCSTFDADDRRVELGQPVPEHVRLLRSESWLPLQALTPVNRASPLYTEDHQQIFYAEAWALVHYLLVGDNGLHRRPFSGFLDGLSSGLAPDRAFAKAFASSDKALEADLRQYIFSGLYADESLRLERPARDVASSVKPLATAEAEVFQGRLLMRVGRRDEADPYFARARAIDPVTPRLEESLGFLALGRARYDEAIAHLRQAIAQDPKNHLAHYYYAEVLRRQEMEQGRPLTPDVARAMIGPLRTAIELMPSFARAYYLLGCAYYAIGEDLNEGVRLLETAIRLSPPHRPAMLMLASTQLKMRDCAAAKSTAEAIMAAPDATPAIKGEARPIADKASRCLASR